MSHINNLSKCDFLVFGGAGVPRDSGVPDWKSLVKELLDANPIEDIDIDNTRSDEFPNIAQKIFNNFKEHILHPIKKGGTN